MALFWIIPFILIYFLFSSNVKILGLEILMYTEYLYDLQIMMSISVVDTSPIIYYAYRIYIVCCLINPRA